MTSRNWLRQQLSEGRCVRAIWLELGVPTLAEAAVWAGWDCVVIDNEHGVADLETTVQMVRAVEAAGGHYIVRVPWNDQVYLKRILDRGINTIMVPMINDRESAEAAVAACRYPPDGARGYAAPIVRASHFGAKADYLSTANDELFLLGQIEHRDAIPNIAEIAAVDGIDLLFIGPHDMAGSIGKLERLADDDAEALAAEAEAAILEAGKPMGTVGRPLWSYRDLKQRGHSLVVGPNEIGLFMEAARQAADDMDTQFDAQTPAE
ncbi:HpcH/HpaI aldolase family protein [Tropicimonas marinistellae]|uniref:HpcH/HpaI aldolase family protein n=1 Tax=Tropicimonas marinistellae TaxID=1739787 RepID=UPI0008349547|nr:aldolase/citrate lyase family protein [Tropicimonas marinistellae]